MTKLHPGYKRGRKKRRPTYAESQSESPQVQVPGVGARRLKMNEMTAGQSKNLMGALHARKKKNRLSYAIHKLGY